MINYELFYPEIEHSPEKDPLAVKVENSDNPSFIRLNKLVLETLPSDFSIRVFDGKLHVFRGGKSKLLMDVIKDAIESFFGMKIEGSVYKRTNAYYSRNIFTLDELIWKNKKDWYPLLDRLPENERLLGKPKDISVKDDVLKRSFSLFTIHRPLVMKVNHDVYEWLTCFNWRYDTTNDMIYHGTDKKTSIQREIVKFRGIDLTEDRYVDASDRLMYPKFDLTWGEIYWKGKPTSASRVSMAGGACQLDEDEFEIGGLEEYTKEALKRPNKIIRLFNREIRDYEARYLSNPHDEKLRREFVVMADATHFTRDITVKITDRKLNYGRKKIADAIAVDLELLELDELGVGEDFMSKLRGWIEYPDKYL